MFGQTFGQASAIGGSLRPAMSQSPSAGGAGGFAQYSASLAGFSPQAVGAGGFAQFSQSATGFPQASPASGGMGGGGGGFAQTAPGTLGMGSGGGFTVQSPMGMGMGMGGGGFGQYAAAGSTPAGGVSQLNGTPDLFQAMHVIYLLLFFTSKNIFANGL